MKRLLFCSLAFLVALSSCKKESGSDQPISTWVIGTDSFSTNNIEYIQSDKAGISVVWKANGSNSSYYTILTHLPADGKRFLYTGVTGVNPAYLEISFSIHNIKYTPYDTLATATVSRLSNVFSISLPPTRFRQSNDSSKSTLVSAVLRYKE